MMKKTKSRSPLSGQHIDAMTPAQRRKLLADIKAATPEQRRAESMPLAARDRDRMVRIGRGIGRGRPKLGKGTKIVSVSVELDLLKAADAFAVSRGLKRAELFSLGLRAILPRSARS